MQTTPMFFKKEFSIDNVHMLTGIPKSKIRFWEKSFSDYLKPNRTEGGRRRYKAEDLEKLSKINYLLNHERYTIEGARKRLEKSDDFSVVQDYALPKVRVGLEP
ncbi:MerR family transcriptional regulator [candidate division KSB1 bacterium]